jgi:hypothetical protein
MEFFGSMMDSGSSEDGEELYVLLDGLSRLGTKSQEFAQDDDVIIFNYYYAVRCMMLWSEGTWRR